MLITDGSVRRCTFWHFVFLLYLAGLQPVNAEPTSNAASGKSGSATGRIVGTVTHGGKGMGNMQILVCSKINMISGCEGRKYTAQTSANGDFVVDGVVADVYSVAAGERNSGRKVFITESSPGQIAVGAAQFKVIANQTTQTPTIKFFKKDLDRGAKPGEGESMNTAQPKLMWKAYPGASSYSVVISAYEKTSMYQRVTVKTGETEHIPKAPLLNGIYYWQVAAFDSSNSRLNEFNSLRHFKVVGQIQPPPPVKILMPREGAGAVSGLKHFKWKAHPDADAYEFEYGVQYKPRTPLKIKTNSVTLGTPLTAGKYSFEVFALKAEKRIARSGYQTVTAK